MKTRKTDQDDSQDDLSQQVMDLLLPFCEADKINWKGHFQQGVYFSAGEFRKDMIKDHFMNSMMFRLAPQEQLRELATAIQRGEILEAPLVLPVFRGLECPFCAQRSRMGFNGQSVVLLDDACPYPDGIITEWELNVPSGKIVVANDLRNWFPVDENHDVNTVIGCHLTTLAYAKRGMAHGFVSNTSPGVYRTGSGFVIGSYYEDWDENEEENEDIENEVPCPWGESVASICTDLWWYSIADADELERRRQHYTPDESSEEMKWDVVDVRPGVYKFRQKQGINCDAPVVEYATFEWVREPDPVRDYLKEERDVDNQFVKGKPGYYHQSGGHFSWWPVDVYRGKPWPKEVPVLNETNFHFPGNGAGLRGEGFGGDDPDKRFLNEWMDGFPRDHKVDTVYEAIRKAIKEITGRGIGGNYKMWMWEVKQNSHTLAQVWNRAMENLGYTEMISG